MAGVLKKTTGLAGMAVSVHPHRDLGDVYAKILRVLATLPTHVAYRKHTEKLVQERMSILQKNTDVSAIEEAIGCGQFEELIIQAKYELTLANTMKIRKPWESLVEEPPENQWTWPPHK